MKRHLFILFQLLFLIDTMAQKGDVYEMLYKIDSSLNSIEQMSYLIDYHYTPFMEDVILSTRAMVHISRQEEDSLHFYFNIHAIKDGYQYFYNGDHLLLTSMKDSSAVIIDNTSDKAYQYIYGSNARNFIPLVLFKGEYFSDFLNDTNVLDITVSDEEYNNLMTYKLSVRLKANEEFSEMESHYFIDKESFMVIGAESSVYLNEIYEQKIAYSLHDIHINPYTAEAFWTIDYHLLECFKVEYITPGDYKSAPMLEAGTTAPSFAATTVSGEPFESKDYEGKIVLLDFWYISCYPCLKMMDDLKILSGEFKNENVEIVGINNIDSKEKMTAFLDKKNVKYTNIYNCKDVIMDYKISVYPTLYIINTDGKIVAVRNGWSEALLDELREILKDELK